MKEYLNVSEIGKLFGLGIQTIHYYDKTGLLKPMYRDEKNGYRKYKFDQIYQLASIRYMRKLGYSIDDVRQYQKERHPEETIQLLKERSAALQAQWEELMRIDGAILRKIQYIEQEMAQLDVAAVKVQVFPERHYIKIGKEEEIYMDDSFYFYPTVVFYEDGVKEFGAYVAELPEADTAEQTMRIKDAGGIKMDEIPAGQYLTGYHKGSYETIQQRFDELKALYPQYNYGERIASFNIIDQFVEQDSENYITEIQIQILDE